MSAMNDLLFNFKLNYFVIRNTCYGKFGVNSLSSSNY